MAYYFYALRSRRDGKLYKGVAADVDARLAQHNGGKTKSLRHRRPLEVSYVERHGTRQEALARERWSKTLAGAKALRRLMQTRESHDRLVGPSTEV
jgi:putative endonuclease